MTRQPSDGKVAGMRLPPRWRMAVLTVHVITAVGWLGVDLVLLTFGIAGLSGADPDLVYPAQRASSAACCSPR
jgi:hypothetical protein